MIHTRNARINPRAPSDPPSLLSFLPSLTRVLAHSLDLIFLICWKCPSTFLYNVFSQQTFFLFLSSHPVITYAFFSFNKRDFDSMRKSPISNENRQALNMPFSFNCSRLETKRKEADWRRSRLNSNSNTQNIFSTWQIHLQQQQATWFISHPTRPHRSI